MKDLEELKKMQGDLEHYIKPACEFYLRYVDMPYMFVYDYSNYLDKLIEAGVYEMEDGQPMLKENGGKKFNKWLFELIFSKVFEKKER